MTKKPTWTSDSWATNGRRGFATRRLSWRERLRLRWYEEPEAMTMTTTSSAAIVTPEIVRVQLHPVLGVLLFPVVILVAVWNAVRWGGSRT